MTRKERQEIRQEMRIVLGGLDPRWLKGASAELGNNIGRFIDQHLEFDIHHILAWTSFFAGEPDLSAFIASRIEKTKVYLPRVLPDGGMDFISLGRNWDNQIQAGMYGIPEPNSGAGEPYNIANAAETLVIVPGLAFDAAGHRLGRGKGYYDRFLGKAGMQNAIKLGVCWAMQVVDKITPESHDIPMDWICHERGFIGCAEASTD